MFLPDEIVMYGADLCKIEAVREESFFPGQSPRLYYILHPLSREDSTVYVPCEQGESKLRAVMTVNQITDLRERTEGKRLEWIADRQLRARVYTQILQQGDPEQIMLLIHCLQNRREELSAAGKKLSVSDERLLVSAEKMVEGEFSYVMGTDGNPQ